MCPMSIHKGYESVVAFLRERVIRLIIYLDDPLVISNNRQRFNCLDQFDPTIVPGIRPSNQ